MGSMSVYIPDVVRQDVIEHATEVDRSASWVITRAISEYLTRRARQDGHVLTFDTDEWEQGPEIEARIKEKMDETGMDRDHVLMEALVTWLGIPTDA